MARSCRAGLAAGWMAVAVAAAAAEPSAPASTAAALREALAADEGGDHEAAARALARIAEAAPEIADHARELRIEVLLAAAGYDEVLSEAAAFRERFSGSWLLGHVARHEADAQVARGDEDAARAAWSEALRLADRDEAQRAQLIAELARSLERSGDPGGAAERWSELWTRYAASPEADEAGRALERLAAADAGLRYRTPEALRERCLRLSGALRNEAALVACGEAIAGAPADRGLRRERADVLFRMRRYGEAVEAFRALGGEDREATFWLARSLARAGRIEESLATFARVAGSRADEVAARARFLSGTLLEDTDRSAAEAAYREVAASAPLASQRVAARWRLAWLAWQRGDVTAAASGFERVAADASERVERARGRYWHARAVERLTPGGASAELVALAREEPFGYYGWRAASRVELPAQAEPAVAAAPAAQDPGLPPRALLRIEILLGAGLDERARVEIGSLTSHSASPGARLALGQLLLEAGRFDAAERIAVDYDGDRLLERPTPGEELRWWLAWPTAYDADVRRSAGAHGVEPALVFAIMREESGYRADALSVVGARGLTQIMPDTGRRLASDLGHAGFDPADLFVPSRNLDLGAFYLSQLLLRFEGRLSAAIASYNAGPEAVSRWLAAAPEQADDEWIESIPYDQTRSYVKRVLRSVAAYRALYGG